MECLSGSPILRLPYVPRVRPRLSTPAASDTYWPEKGKRPRQEVEERRGVAGF